MILHVCVLCRDLIGGVSLNLIYLFNWYIIWSLAKDNFVTDDTVSLLKESVEFKI